MILNPFWNLLWYLGKIRSKWFYNSLKRYLLHFYRYWIYSKKYSSLVLCFILWTPFDYRSLFQFRQCKWVLLESALERHPNPLKFCFHYFLIMILKKTENFKFHFLTNLLKASKTCTGEILWEGSLMQYSKLLQIYSIIVQKLYFHPEIYGLPKDCTNSNAWNKKEGSPR